jgi:hypothetical protein
MYKITSLNEESGFNELVTYYDKNCDRPWQEWLKIKKIFPNPGKQGLVGLATSKKGEQTYVFKISQYINYLVQHELSVMKALNEIGKYCPHFCRAIGAFLCEVDPECRKDGNPFENEGKYPIEKEVLLMEYIENSTKFYNYIRSKRISEDVLYSTVKQTLMAIAIAQKKKRFTHYDLHSNNIMMRKCNKDLVFLYILDESSQYCVPSRGHYPVIIDFGFSYVGDMDDSPLWPTLGHSKVGFMSDRFDPIADPKLFLVTVAGEIHEKKKTRKSRKLKNVVKNMFSKLNIDWESGWDAGVKKSASDYLLDMMRDYNTTSRLFDNFDHYCIDIIQTLVVLPLQEQKYSEINLSYNAFLKEFVKIEEQIGNPFYNMYILKGIVDAAREIRPDYVKKESRKHALKYFQQVIYQRIDKIAKWCRPKDLHFEKLLCSLLCLGKCVEGVLYDAMFSQMRKKERSYRKLPLQNPEQMYAVIDMNIEDTYEFNENTSVMVVNCINDTCDVFSPTESQRSEINEFASISRGAELYKIYKNMNR